MGKKLRGIRRVINSIKCLIWIITGREIIILETRKDAEDLLSAVEDVFEMYGLVTVADLRDLCSVTSSYEDNLIGWKDSDSIARAYITRDKYGYKLIFPKPVSLKMKGEKK